MPVALLNSYIVMLPRLKAREVLEQVTAVGIGFGGSEEGISQLQKQARGETVPDPKIQQMSGRAFAASMGFPIKISKKKVEGP